MSNKRALYFFLCSILVNQFVWANSVENSARNILKNRYSDQDLAYVATALVKSNYPLIATPLIKEILSLNAKHPQLDAMVDRYVNFQDLRLIESLSPAKLIYTESNKIAFILARKLFNRGKFDAAKTVLKKINNRDQQTYARSQLLLATIEMIRGDNKSALTHYRKCERLTSRSTLENHKIKDNCLAGKARVLFANQNYQKAESHYLDIDKSSPIWPDIIFEEAWTSFYLQKYNRTLGKLVTFKAPVLSQFLNPEIEVLTAFSYLKLCLYSDVKMATDAFYRKYKKPFENMKKIIRTKTARSYYGRMYLAQMNEKTISHDLLARVIYMVSRSEHARDLYNTYQTVNDIKPSSGISGPLAEVINRNKRMILNDALEGLGELVIAKIRSFIADFDRAFKGVSYIKLEALRQQKEKMYYGEHHQGEKRGKLKYLKRTNKQYFWHFRGEFWADELGDFVFALKDEC